MPYQKETGLFSTPSVNCSGHVANITSQKQVQEPWMFRKETKYPCKKWEALIQHSWQMTPIRAAFILFQSKYIITEDPLSIASQHSLVSSISRQCMTRTQRKIFVDFRTEIGRSQKSHFLFPNIARRPHITQHLVFLNLSRASCIFGHVDIK